MNDTLKPPAGANRQENIEAAERSFVNVWTDKINRAKRHWNDDFQRMRENMKFAAGIQWRGQTSLLEDRYIANWTIRTINAKVASLYARNPKAIARRRQRLEFQIWDGRMESISAAKAIASQPTVEPTASAMSRALLSDLAHGRAHKDQIDRIGRTLEILYQWNVDNQQPDFKVQMKQLVRRVCVCGVGYVKLDYLAEHEGSLGSTDTESTIKDRIRQLKQLASDADEDKFTADSAEMQQWRNLMIGLMGSLESGDAQNINQRLLFDFPEPTSIIIDPACRAIKGFVGARWIAAEHDLTIKQIEAFYGVTLDGGYNDDRRDDSGNYSQTPADGTGYGDVPDKEKRRMWEVWDLDTKCTFCIVQGHKDLVCQVTPVQPETNHFWPVFALTFNDIDSCYEGGSTIFPPSDVQLLAPAQKEWNRIRNSLRAHRRAANPKILTAKGWMTENDRESIQTVPEVGIPIVEIEGAEPGTDVTKLLAPFKHPAIDASLYDTGPLVQDALFIIGNEQVAQPASNKATATASTINEQNRMSTTSSNIDDLDDLLSDLAQAAGEMMLREFTAETVKRIVGPGALWSELDRENIVNKIYLDVVASSSGRPNRALEIANWAQIAPILIQTGVSPDFIARETMKRLDDRLELDDALPMGPPAPAPSLSVKGPQTATPRLPAGSGTMVTSTMPITS